MSQRDTPRSNGFYHYVSYAGKTLSLLYKLAKQASFKSLTLIANETSALQVMNTNIQTPNLSKHASVRQVYKLAKLRQVWRILNGLRDDSIDQLCQGTAKPY